MEERGSDSGPHGRRPWRSKASRAAAPATAIAAAAATSHEGQAGVDATVPGRQSQPLSDGTDSDGSGSSGVTNVVGVRTAETYRLLCAALASNDVPTVSSFVAGRSIDGTKAAAAAAESDGRERGALRSVRYVAQQLSDDDVWGVLRLVLNQLTTADVDHKGGRADFRVVEAIYPIRNRLAVQQRLVTYCVTFPLPTTGQQASAQRFVTVFTDSIVTFGCDMSFVFHLLLYFMFLHRGNAPWEDASSGAARCNVTVPSYLRALTPDLPWHTIEPVSYEVRQQWGPFFALAKDAQFSCPATYTARVAWIMIGELAAHGYMPAAVLLQSLARHPEAGIHVLPDVWRQVLHTMAMVHAPESNRVPWPLLHELLEGDHNPCAETDQVGVQGLVDESDSSIFTRDASCGDASVTHAASDPRAARAAEEDNRGEDEPQDGPLPVPLLVFEDIEEDVGGGEPPLTNRFGFALRLRAVHRDILEAMKQYETRMTVFVETKAFNALNQRGTTSVTPSVRKVVNCWTPSCALTEVVRVHDYHLVCLFRKLGMPAALCSYLVETFVARPPLSTFTSALVLKYAISCRAMETQLEHLLQ